MIKTAQRIHQLRGSQKAQKIDFVFFVVFFVPSVIPLFSYPNDENRSMMRAKS
jgi:hypothetical protein